MADITSKTLSEIRALHKELYPDRPVGGKGITRKSLIDNIISFRAVSDITKLVKAEDIKKYYRNVSDDNETFDKLTKAIELVQNPNDFSGKWDISEWNSDKAWMEYHREMGIIGSDTEYSNILEQIHGTFMITELPKNSNTFGKQFPVVTWTIAYLNGGLAMIVVINNTDNLELVKLLNQYINKYTLPFAHTDAIRDYIEKIVSIKDKKRRKILQSLLDAKTVDEPRETIIYRNRKITIPVPGDIIYYSRSGHVGYYLITDITRGTGKLGLYYTVVNIKQKYGGILGIYGYGPAVKSDFELSEELTLYRSYPKKFRKDDTIDVLFIEKEETVQIPPIVIPPPEPIVLSLLAARALLNLPVDEITQREIYKTRYRDHVIPVIGDILHVYGTYGTYGSSCVDQYYLVVSVRRNYTKGKFNIWYNVLKLDYPEYYQITNKHSFDIRNLDIIKYYPKQYDTKHKIEQILFI